MDPVVNEPQPPAQPDVLTVDHHAAMDSCPMCGQALLDGDPPAAETPIYDPATVDPPEPPAAETPIYDPATVDPPEPA